MKLSVVLAVRNEEANLARCLESIKHIASEIVIVDEYSTDNTISIAKKYGARVYKEPHHAIFHITKQKALSYAKSEWILQLDADEVVTPSLGIEIIDVINGKSVKIDLKKEALFRRHQRVVEMRDGRIGKRTGEVVAYFIPSVNMFLGKPLIHAGVYPDAVIRLIKNGKAHFPAKSVHEQIEIEGEVGWLNSDLEHYDSPTLTRYIDRANRYTSLTAKEFEQKNVVKNLLGIFYYSVIKPSIVFLKLYFRHRVYLDGIRGFLWSYFCAIHYSIAYFKYYSGGYESELP